MVLIAGRVQAETPLEFPDAGFEERSGWSPISAPMAALHEDAAHTGTIGLRIVDKSRKMGSNVRSAHLPVSAGASYAVRFWAKAVSQAGVAVYADFFNADRKMVTTQAARNQITFTVPGSQKTWKRFTLVARAPENAATLTLWVHSYNGAVASADFDDFSVSQLTSEEAMSVKTTPTASTKSKEFQPPTKERIAEIAKLLAPEPAGLFRPITDRVSWDELRKVSSADGIIKRAEGYAETPPPDCTDELYLEFSKNGNRTNYQRPYGQASTRINYLVVAECLENKGRFFDAIARDMLAMCGHRSWVMPAHDGRLTNFKDTLITVDLGSSARGWMLTNALYWLGDRLPESVRASVRSNVQRRVLDPYLAALRGGSTRGNWWIRGTNNWNAVCNAGVIGTALALVETAAGRAEFIVGAEISDPFFLSGFTADGYCSEGMGYWNYGFGHYLMLGLMVREATGGTLDFFESPILKAISAFPLNILIQPSMAPAFADCGVGAKPGSDALAMIDHVYPEIIPGEYRLSSPLAGGIVSTGIRTMCWAPPTTPAAITAEALPRHSWFGEAGILVSRDLPGVEHPFSAAIKGGHNAEHHNHNDVGSYAIVLDGTPFLLDPGGEIYTRRTFSSQRYVSKVLNSYGHPVPIVDGELQTTGRHSKAEILETEFTEKADRFVMDLAKAYPVDELTSLVRTFVHDRGARTITIEDVVTLGSPKPFGTCLVTYEKVHRRDDGTFVVYDQKHAVEVQVASEGGELEYAYEEIENPGRPSPKRLGFNFKAPVAKGRVMFTVKPTTMSGDLPGIYTEPKWQGAAPDQDRGVMVQAEAFTKQTGGEVTVCEKIGADGKCFKFWDELGHILEWQIAVPQTGRYAVLVRACHDSENPVTRALSVDGNAVLGDGETFLFPHTGGWSSRTDDWRNVWLSAKGKPAILDLAAGQHTLTFTNTSGIGLNLDWVKLVPVEE
jgi:hypothetical protein